MELSGPAAACELLAEVVLGCCRDEILKLTSPLSLCFLQEHGICSEHTGTCARQTMLVLTNISMLVAITMLPEEDLVVLGQPE